MVFPTESPITISRQTIRHSSCWNTVCRKQNIPVVINNNGPGLFEKRHYITKCTTKNVANLWFSDLGRCVNNINLASSSLTCCTASGTKKETILPLVGMHRTITITLSGQLPVRNRFYTLHWDEFRLKIRHKLGHVETPTTFNAHGSS